jgi:hypothetical protein
MYVMVEPDAGLRLGLSWAQTYIIQKKRVAIAGFRFEQLAQLGEIELNA